MPVDPIRFFDEPRLHSRRKHRLLGRYLPVWAAKLSSTSRVVYCVDGFAGPGKYAGTGEAGSPLMMAQLIDRAASWRVARALHVIAVESDPELHADLARLVQPWVDRGSMTVYQGAFDVALVERILQQIGAAPAYFFLDPFNQGDLPRSVLDAILPRNAPTDVTVNFNGPDLVRMAARLCEGGARSGSYQPALPNLESAQGRLPGSTGRRSSISKAAAATVRAVDAVEGSENWRDGFCDLDPAAQVAQLRRCYLAGAHSLGYATAWYPIRPSLNERAKYDLIHFARHPDAFILLNDFICKEEDELYSECHEDELQARGDPLLPDFTPDARLRERHALLRDRVLALLAERPGSQRDLRNRLIFEGELFGSFQDRDLTAVRNELSSAGRITQANPADRTRNDKTVWRISPQ